MDNYQKYIAVSRYARYLPDKKRRETWEETIKRLMDYWESKFPEQVGEVRDELEEAIRTLEVMPSMRTLLTAGPALDRDNVAGFNCSYLAINRPRSFDELMYILLCGTGVGFSVERQYVSQLPEVAEDFHESDTTIVVGDSKIGWATAFRELVSLLYGGKIPRWDMSAVRPAGSPLKTFGGRASGPEPLDELFRFTVALFKRAKGRKLQSIEAHDLCCKIAEIVVVGGVRRSALLSLSNLTDQRMAMAKSGEWWKDNVQRALANNSICFTEKPDVGAFMREWNTIYESKSGERGIFNRVAAKKQALKTGRRDENYDWGCNPCSEIILRDRQFCNLSEVVIRSGDTLEDLGRKVRLATILGTLQATLTNFRYLSKKWKDNTEEEALLGVSLTGIMDHPILSHEYVFEDWENDIKWESSIAEFFNYSSKGEWNEQLGITECDNPMTEEEWFEKFEEDTHIEYILKTLKEVAIATNIEWSERLGIKASTSITCVKPSGTVSQLVDAASGIHPRYSPHYIRTVRADKKDPLAIAMHKAGYPCEDDVTKPHSTWVFSFPVKAPEGSVFRDDRSAVEQLELWLTYQRYWCEHKPSITVYVKEEEWPEVGAWVWNHFDEVSGVSFLPHTEHTYKQAPYQEINEEQYYNLLDRMPNMDLEFEEEYDATVGGQTLACTGDSCEIVDLTETT